MAIYNPLDTTTKKFDPYEAVKTIADYKTGWHTADKSGDRAKADEYAKKAQKYYKQLRENGYSDVADALTNTNDVGASYIVKDFLKNNSAPTTPTTAETPKADTTTITGKINDLYGIQKSDRDTMAKKYDTLEDYNYNYDPYDSKIGKSIMENYKFQGKTASDNAVASGGADNGGNIDSYAAANANRQQLAFTNAGTQAVLNDFSTRIGHAKDILNNLGVYQQNQDKGMQTTINQQQTEEQRVFDNSETSKNNDVSRKKTISEVTGFAPNEWIDANNEFLDENGNLKAEYENIDFSAIMANAKKNGNTELYNQASVARAKKIFGNYTKYGKYDDGNYTLNGTKQTETGRQFDKNAELSEKDIETTAELTKAELEANERMNNADNATNLTIADMELSAKLAEAEEDKTWTEELKDFDLSDNAKTLLNAYAYEAWQNGEQINILDVLANNADALTALDATEILRMYNIKNSDVAEEENGEKLTIAEWLEKYTWYDPNESGYTPE